MDNVPIPNKSVPIPTSSLQTKTSCELVVRRALVRAEPHCTLKSAVDSPSFLPSASTPESRYVPALVGTSNGFNWK